MTYHPFRAKMNQKMDSSTLYPAGHQIASNRQQLEPNYFLCLTFLCIES